jgi:hypothetical protein
VEWCYCERWSRFHSIVGNKGDQLGDEYVLFRYGQAIPLYQIEYQ